MANALDLFRLDGKVAVVTGGSKGIGMYYSSALVDAGANVVVADIDPVTVKETTERLDKEHPAQVLGVEVDVGSSESVRAMVQRTQERWGRLDILVNNAALFSALPIRETPWDVPDDEFDRVMAINVRSMYRCVTETLDLMRRGRDTSNWGKVINVASGLSFKGSPALIHYAASKGAVVNLTRSLATALAPSGITVNAIAPGGTDSPTVIAARPNRDPSRQIQQRLIKRVEVPEDLIGTLLYLASPASDFVTGQTIVVDGGSVLH